MPGVLGSIIVTNETQNNNPQETNGPARGRRRTAWNEIDSFLWPGLRLLEAGEGVARVELGVEDHHRGGGSSISVNGGIVSYMFDGMLAAAVESVWDELVIGQVTITLNVQFVDAIGSEERKEGVACVLRRGAGLVFAEGHLRREGQARRYLYGRLQAPSRPQGSPNSGLSTGHAGTTSRCARRRYENARPQPG